ncbi:MAG: ORF6N domain-containing protein [Flavobacteriia bacterium]|nr:ORF6N domain-containing protein [Flavobacteriia bacterium]
MEITQIHQKIYEIRGQKVMLDRDLSKLYQVETKYLNLVVKRNLERFPFDFMFQLNIEEWESLRLQIETSKGKGGTRYLPYAFSEQGIAMLSGLLNSQVAIQVNIMIMRTFVHIRQFALSHVELSVQLKQLEQKYDQQFDDIFEVINYLMKKESMEKQTKERGNIGYRKGG